jgi:hypothetical protein
LDRDYPTSRKGWIGFEPLPMRDYPTYPTFPEFFLRGFFHEDRSGGRGVLAPSPPYFIFLL